MKAYVVKSGEYSDQNIEAVFSTRAVAEEYIDAVGSDYGWEVMEFDFDPIDWRGKKNVYSVRVDIRAGVVTIKGVTKPGDYCFDNARLKVDTFCFDGSRSIDMWLLCDGRKNVRKIASERWMQINALQQIAFKYMYNKVVVNYMHFGLPSHEYPVYNYVTKEIVLNKDMKLELPDDENPEASEFDNDGFMFIC